MPSRGTKVDVLVAWTVCTQPNQHILQEAWRRFHSGYSSFSVAGLGYLSLSSRELVLLPSLLPPLRSVDCDTPYNKADTASSEGFSRLDDEEQALLRPLVPRNDYTAGETYQLDETSYGP
ncbi:hypothetical protein PENNAL_c0023G03423 [Penicillium nalgiovense]|uniref:Uncharacterized protein n=1 Tax=Penicillium nalgiovense TaxID=60175 RepID=A0A1V6YE78_PENNA|nr:hypothetical protein PENNAL_c0023G03423 [Penicillium nalgiovense]